MTPPADAADALVAAIHAGDVAAARELVSRHPGLATEQLGGRAGTRTALHVTADWPGYFPNAAEMVRMLLAAGADPNVRDPRDPRSETPLHWAASSDDVEVAEALIDGGADMDIPGGSIGTPLANAVGYACWHVARLLVQRGARVEEPWQAAALGMTARLDELLGADPAAETVSQAFWHACAGRQRRTAEHLLNRGADLDWIPDYARGTPLDAASARSTRQENVITWLRERGAQSADALG